MGSDCFFGEFLVSFAWGEFWWEFLVGFVVTVFGGEFC